MQAHPEFDVFDGRPGKALIEASRGAELLFPDSAAPSPESSRVTVRPVVDKAMEQVAKSTDASGRSRMLIIRTEERIQVRICLERACESIERIRMNGSIRIQEDEDVSGRFCGRGVPGGRRTALRGQGHEHCSLFRDNVPDGFAPPARHHRRPGSRNPERWRRSDSAARRATGRPRRRRRRRQG